MPRGVVGRLATLPGMTRIWLLNGALVLVAAALFPLTELLPAPETEGAFPVWLMVGLVVAAETSTVHFRFRRDSFTFSLSEIPLVLGLYLMDPATFLVAQAVGNLIAFGAFRRNTPIKLVFNVGQYVVQSGVAIIVFRASAQFGDPLGPFGWLGVLMAAGASLLIADFLITRVVVASGGSPSRQELNDVLRFSSVASTMNVALGLVAVMIIDTRPQAAWLAFVPIAVLFVAYRAYTSQVAERMRTAAMYEITRDLHESTVIDDALDAVAVGAARMFDTRWASILIFPEWGGKLVYQTSVEAGEISARMQPAVFDYLADPWNRMVRAEDGSIVVRSDSEPLGFPGVGPVETAMVVPISSDARIVGLMMVAGPNSQMTVFDEEDLRSLASIARQLATALDKGRLEDSLNEVMDLKAQLEESIRSKDQFIASVSHELRTPLTGIVGLAEALKADRDVFTDAELDEFMEMITQQGAELGNIIEDLLVAARADIGTLSVKPIVADVAHDLESILASHATRSDVDIDIAVHGERPEAIYDPLRFRQIIRNLVTNAIRYGGSQVWAEVTIRRGAVVVSIVDNGRGVPEGSEQKIFRAYGTGSNSSGNPSSVGLGLAVSRQLAGLMGGELVYRRADSCSRFELTLPLASIRLDSPTPDADLEA